MTRFQGRTCRPSRCWWRAPAPAKSWPPAQGDRPVAQGWRKLLAIGLDEKEANAFLPFRVSITKSEHISAYFDPFDSPLSVRRSGPGGRPQPRPARSPAREGRSHSDRRRRPGTVTGREVVFCQLVPWQFEDTGKMNIKPGFQFRSAMMSGWHFGDTSKMNVKPRSAASRSCFRGPFRNLGAEASPPILQRIQVAGLRRIRKTLARGPLSRSARRVGRPIPVLPVVRARPPET